MWIYVIGPILGGLIAAFIFNRYNESIRKYRTITSIKNDKFKKRISSTKRNKSANQGKRSDSMNSSLSDSLRMHSFHK